MVERYGLLASAIAGRSLKVRPAGAGDVAWTDGATVFVDAGARPFDQVQALAVQASLLALGSLDPAIVGRLVGRPKATRRYLSLEGHRALAANDDVLPGPVRSLIDGAVARRVDTPMASLAMALGRERFDDAPPCFGVIKPRRLLASHDSVAAGEPASTATDRSSPFRVGDELDTDDDDAGALGHLPDVFSSSGGRGLLGRLLRKSVGLRREPGGGPLGAEMPASARLLMSRGGAVSVATGAAGRLEGVPVVERRGKTYPEWDVYRHRYRQGWCTVDVVDPGQQDLGAPVVPDELSLRRPLARLGVGLDRCHRQLQGDDLDIHAAVEARIEVLSGSAPDEAVYIDSLRRRRDLAVLVLLDISGSSGQPGAGGVAVHELQRAAAAAITAALFGLGDRVALYAFYSKGRSAVHLVRVKSFDDHLDMVVMQRLGGLVPGAYTRLGAAIRHGALILEEQAGTPRRLLVVLSDGFAYDHGYEGPYAEADARRALAEARRRGTGCLCISIGSGTDLAALSRVFGTAAHATVPGPDHLKNVIGPMFRAALRSAESQRRTTLRKVRSRERLETEASTA